MYGAQSQHIRKKGLFLTRVLATWDIRSNKYALMISSMYVFFSLSTERARFSTLLFPPSYFGTDIPSSQHKIQRKI